MVTSREIRLKSRPVGMPSAENFELATVTVPAPRAGRSSGEEYLVCQGGYAKAS
jgi:NADPH-dependent curcumin reductase CurA